MIPFAERMAKESSIQRYLNALSQMRNNTMKKKMGSHNSN